jgi:Sulfotransferase family
MISFQKRFLFVHIPKTAGNSIQSVLREYSEDEIVALRRQQDGIERFGLRNPKYKIKKHSTLVEYRTALGEALFRDLYKFTCVRNPWDRMVSLYFRASRGEVQWDPKAFRKMVQGAHSAADYLRLEKREKDPFVNVDCILRFETLAEDFRMVCAKLEIPALSLPQYNRSDRGHYTIYYDDALRALVRNRFAAEIERFGYTFD